MNRILALSAITGTVYTALIKVKTRKLISQVGSYSSLLDKQRMSKKAHSAKNSRSNKTCMRSRPPLHSSSVGVVRVTSLSAWLVVGCSEEVEAGGFVTGGGGCVLAEDGMGDGVGVAEKEGDGEGAVRAGDGS